MPPPSQACAGCGSIQSTTPSTQFTQSTQSTTQSTTRSATQSPQSPTDDTAALDRQSDPESCPAPKGDIEDLEARVPKLDLQPTTQSRQQLQARIFELEQRPTIQSHTLLQDKIVDLDRHYSQVVLSLEAEVTDLQDQLAIEVQLRQHAQSEVDRQKQFRADEEADYIAEVDSHKMTKKERNNCVVELQSSNNQRRLQYQRLGVSSTSRKKRLCTALIAERRKARLQTRTAVTTIQQKRFQVHDLLERLQGVTIERDDLQKVQHQSDACKLVMQQLLLCVQIQCIRQSKAHTMIIGTFKNKLSYSELKIKRLKREVEADSVVHEIVSTMALMMSTKATRQTRRHTSFGSKVRSKIERLRHPLRASNVVLAETKLSLDASEQLNGELVRRLDHAQEVQPAMRVLLDVASAKYTRLARWHASLVDKARSKVDQLNLACRCLQTRIDHLALDVSTHREEAGMFRKQVGRLGTAKTRLETQVKNSQKLQSETYHGQQNAKSQIDALQKEIGDYEQAFEITIQSRTDVLIFIHSHFGISDPLCAEEKIKDDLDSQDRLV
ncbi:hypothetical protein N0V87_010601 [Didymella glomerata]|uniref:Uncharacterized protein n=1 Tax=Didymella glomerata TaxID=749621 RepID=A0A9W9BUV8_9PLEO|nr:hypothetical protein N0V87_010601 [Didymella glomerata]